MDKKYFFFDIDGTLTDIQTAIPVPSALETIKKLQDKGHFVAIATGRAYYKTKDTAKMLGIHNLVSNGGAALIYNDELVTNSPLDREKALALIHEADEKGFGILIAVNDSIDVVMNDERFIEQVGERQEPTRYILDKSLNYDDLKDIYKIYIAIPEDKEEELTLRDTVGHIRFVPPYLTYQHDAKEKGIIKMMEYLKADIKDVVVFGDGENDLVMFKKEWTSIAMGNGVEDLKKKADFVTKDSTDDGVEYACRHFGWID